LVGSKLAGGEPVQNLSPARGAGGVARRGVFAGRRIVAQRADHLVEAAADGGIGDFELPLDVADDAAVLEEHVDEPEQLAAEAVELGEVEDALQPGAALLAAQV